MYPFSTPGSRTPRLLAISYHAVKRFWQIEGSGWARSFAYSAFFSLFPMVILVVTIASLFIEQGRAEIEVIGYFERFVPMTGEMQQYIYETIAGVISARRQASVVALLLLVWVAIQCFTTLILVTNLAWGAAVHDWWRLPMKSLAMLCIVAIAFLLGIAIPVLATVTEQWLFPNHSLRFWIHGLGSYIIHMSAVFVSLMLLYKFAPRRNTTFSEVWLGAFVATVLLRVSESLFVIYLNHFAALNAVYGAFGGIMALLLWIYLSGCIFIFGACLCVAQNERGAKLI